MRNVFASFFAIIMMIHVESARTPLNRMTQFPYSGTILSSFFRVMVEESLGDEYQVDFSGVAPGADISIRFEITTPDVLTTTFLAVSSN